MPAYYILSCCICKLDHWLWKHGRSVSHSLSSLKRILCFLHPVIQLSRLGDWVRVRNKFTRRFHYHLVIPYLVSDIVKFLENVTGRSGDVTQGSVVRRSFNEFGMNGPVKGTRTEVWWTVIMLIFGHITQKQKHIDSVCRWCWWDNHQVLTQQQVDDSTGGEQRWFTVKNTMSDLSTCPPDGVQWSLQLV